MAQAGLLQFLRETKEYSMTRKLVALLALATLGAIAWYGYWMLPQRLLYPGFMLFFVIFFAGLTLPYIAVLALLARHDGSDGLRLAAGTSAVNSLWALPLAAMMLLLSGFAMGNRDQVQSLLAVVTAALLQPALLLAAGSALKRARGRSADARSAWLIPVIAPLALSAGSLGYLNWQLFAFKAQSEQSLINSRAAQEKLKTLQSCLANLRESGYPAKLDACAGAAAEAIDARGYRLDYLPALAGPNGRIDAYFLCATPLQFRATGFDTLVADSSGSLGARMTPEANLQNPPTCASVQSVEKAIAWCAYSHAARDPLHGYPLRLADIAPCVTEGRTPAAIGADRLSDNGETYAYLAEMADAQDRVAHFRIYRLGLAGDKASWVSETFKSNDKKAPAPIEQILKNLPALAVPEAFMAGCNAGNGADCFVAGYEWQRKAHQSGGDARNPAAAGMRQAALQAYAKGCELREARACALLGLELEWGNEIERDVVRAAATYEKACAAGDESGCRRGAGMYENGSKAQIQSLQDPAPSAKPKPDLPRDLPRAIALYGQACDLGDRDACFSAGRLSAQAGGASAGRDKALLFFARACSEGLTLACTRAAELAPAEAEAFKHRACVLGEPSACR